MVNTPYRSTVTVDGKKFDCVSVSVAFQTDKDRAGMPQMGSLTTTIRAYVDFHDDVNLPFSSLRSLFDLSNVVTRDKVKPIKFEFWKDDSHQDALASYSFNGWISGFHTLNPYQNASTETDGNIGLNHVLVLDLEASMNQQNFPSILLTN